MLPKSNILYLFEATISMKKQSSKCKSLPPRRVRQVGSVTKWDNKKSPNFFKICPKSRHSSFDLKHAFYISAHSFQIILGYFCMKICHQGLSKYANPDTLHVIYKSQIDLRTLMYKPRLLYLVVDNKSLKWNQKY